jgi:hypothetical protein
MSFSNSETTINRRCHSERSEESQIIAALAPKNSQRCFASLNMTGKSHRDELRAMNTGACFGLWQFGSSDRWGSVQVYWAAD